MAVDKEVWKLGSSDENPSRGCIVGCLMLVIACIALGGLAIWAVWQVGQGLAWLVSLMACA